MSQRTYHDPLHGGIRLERSRPAEARAASLSERVERSGETVFCYTHDASALVNDLAHHATLRCLRRPANLEDVFIKLTGRELRD